MFGNKRCEVMCVHGMCKNLLVAVAGAELHSEGRLGLGSVQIALVG